MNSTQNFTEGKIMLPLASFMFPILLALFLQTMYGGADLLIVGLFSTAAEVSAVSTGSWIMQTITVLITGLAMGTTILLGQKIGERKTKEGGIVIGTSVFLFVLIGIVVTVLLLLLAPAVSSIMHAPEQAHVSTIQYIRICAVGTLFIIAYNVLGSVFRGMGNSRIPLIAVAVACVLNIAGDLVLVAVFKLGAAGAAVATVFSQAVSVVVCLLFVGRIKLPFVFSVKDVRWHMENGFRILKLGIPVALQDVLVSISFLAVISIINSLGVIISAGIGIAERLCGFIMLVPSAYMQGMSAFVAQNIGASKPERAKKALKYAVSTSLAAGFILSYVTFFHGAWLARLFSNDAAVIAVAAEYLKAYAIDCLLVSFLFCFTGYFNGCGRTKFVMAQGIFGAFFIRIPISYVMSRRIPVSLFCIGLSSPSASVVQVVCCLLFFVWLNRKPDAYKI